LIIATMARLVATDPVVAAKLGTAVVAAAAAEAAGTATEKKWRRSKYKGRGESTSMTVEFASRQG
jgi:hypothetical protein